MPDTEQQTVFVSGDRVQGFGDRVPKMMGRGPYGTVVGQMSKGRCVYVAWDNGTRGEYELYELKKLSSGSPGKYT